MGKLKKGEKLACIPCGREVVVSSCGVASTTVWCCGRPMRPASKVKSAKSAKSAKR